MTDTTTHIDQGNSWNEQAPAAPEPKLPAPVVAAESAVKTAVKDAAAAVIVALPVLTACATFLPGLHVPAADTAILTTVIGTGTGFVSWARKHKLAK